MPAVLTPNCGIPRGWNVDEAEHAADVGSAVLLLTKLAHDGAASSCCAGLRLARLLLVVFSCAPFG